MNYTQLQNLKKFLDSREEVEGIRVGDRVRINPNEAHTVCYTPTSLCEQVLLKEVDGEFMLEGLVCKTLLDFLDRDKSFSFIGSTNFLISLNRYQFNMPTRTYHFTPEMKLTLRGDEYVTPFVNGYRAVINGTVEGKPPLALFKNVYYVAKGLEINPNILSLDEYIHIMALKEGIDPDPIEYTEFTLKMEIEK